ncbi:coiled-coil domain-containing protein 17 [Opisthocomus hoazin]|uniref:coiled-coil domain-containing protein 17 n=1 Tax=Opisthocomus hoazin TaxID=30419 RepID=UPI003F529696
MAGAGGFACPRCRMAFGSRALLRAHRERLGGLRWARRSPPRPRPPGRRAPAPPRPEQPLAGRGEPGRGLLEAHERRVAEIRGRTRQLERRREGLCRRLAALRAGAATDPHPGQEGLEPDRVGRLRAAPGGAALLLNALPPAAGPLAAEARALRLSYLGSGGHDPAVLAQLLHLQAEATALETQSVEPRRGRRGEPPGAGAQGLDAALLAVELENRRLEDQLLALKVRRERRADAGSQAELAQLQAEVGMLRCRTEPRLPPAILPPPVAPPLPPALAAPELFAEPPGPALRSGGPAAPSCPHVPPGLPLAPFAALEDPPPAQEPPAQHKPPRR